jgi:hypothetical protein
MILGDFTDDERRVAPVTKIPLLKMYFFIRN